jgi:hypothetical protein
VRQGLRVESLANVRPAIALCKQHPCLSLGDAFSHLLAEANAWTLVTSNSVLANLSVRVRSWETLLASIALEPGPARVAYPRSPYGLVA